MPDLDELEAKARAAKDAWDAFMATPGPTRPVERARAELNAMTDPDTVLHLIERARAGEGLYEALRYHDRCNESAGCLGMRPEHRAALTDWESLAHSPQEAV